MLSSIRSRSLHIYTARDDPNSCVLQSLHSDAVLKEGSVAFKEWKSPGSAVYYVISVYNVTNADNVMNTKAKPNVTELGPYYYR